MNYFYLTIFWITAFLAHAQNNNFALPERPLGQVSDYKKLLPAEKKNEWESELTALLENDHINIKLVVLPSLYGTPPDFVAKKIGEEWGEKDLQGVIIYVPRQSNTPSFWMGGTKTTEFNQDPRRKNDMLIRMQKRVSGELTETDKVQAAITELGDMLRIFKSVWQQYTIMKDAAQKDAYNRYVERRKKSRIFEIIAYALGALCLILIPTLIILWRQRTKVCYFPATSARRRFGAPYAGGNSVVITLITRQS